MKTTLTLDSRLLAIIGRRFSAFYGAPLPRLGPHPDPWVNDRFSPIALNPQPLPPEELGAALAADFIRVAWLADRFGRDSARIQLDLDELCPPVHPKQFKLPKWWWPVPPIPEPVPHPNWFVAFHLGFLTRLAAVPREGSRLDELLDNAKDRSISAIESAEAEGFQ